MTGNVDNDQMKTVIAANWKMHGDLSWVDKPAQLDLLLPRQKRAHLNMILFPPAPFLYALYEKANPLGLKIGGQDCHWQSHGAYTGEISAAMLKSAGAEYVIIGHSERRAQGETDTQVRAKTKAALMVGLRPVICVGESLVDRQAGKALNVISEQLQASLPGNFNQMNGLIAYEPIWAIGTGQMAQDDDIVQVHRHIRQTVGSAVGVLYGGSVKPENAGRIFRLEAVNGVLIGGASLEMADLASIARQCPDH